MLILARKKGEAIQIGEHIEVKITQIKGDQVKIGINAPKYVEVHRKEVWQDIQQENRKALEGVANLLPLLSNVEKD